jgi:hypothetical protein
MNSRLTTRRSKRASRLGHRCLGACRASIAGWPSPNTSHRRRVGAQTVGGRHSPAKRSRTASSTGQRREPRAPGQRTEVEQASPCGRHHDGHLAGQNSSRTVRVRAPNRRTVRQRRQRRRVQRLIAPLRLRVVNGPSGEPCVEPTAVRSAWARPLAVRDQLMRVAVIPPST